jgi:thiamine biosynthesis lipoprotein ApbE
MLLAFELKRNGNCITADKISSVAMVMKEEDTYTTSKKHTIVLMLTASNTSKATESNLSVKVI